MNLLQCDGPDCKKTTRADQPGFGWIQAEPLGHVIHTDAGGNEPRHYCSFACEHAHTYLLISGDNGK